MADHVVSMRLVNVLSGLGLHFLDERLHLIGSNIWLVTFYGVLRSPQFRQKAICHTLVVNEPLIRRVLHTDLQRLHSCIKWAGFTSLGPCGRCADQTDDKKCDSDTSANKHCSEMGITHDTKFLSCSS